MQYLKFISAFYFIVGNLSDFLAWTLLLAIVVIFSSSYMNSAFRVFSVTACWW